MSKGRGQPTYLYFLSCFCWPLLGGRIAKQHMIKRGQSGKSCTDITGYLGWWNKLKQEERDKQLFAFLDGISFACIGGALSK